MLGVLYQIVELENDEYLLPQNISSVHIAASYFYSASKSVFFFF